MLVRTLGVHHKCRARLVFLNIKFTHVACYQGHSCQRVAWSKRPELPHRGATAIDMKTTRHVHHVKFLARPRDRPRHGCVPH